MREQFWYLLVNGPLSKGTCALADFYVKATDLGAAIHKAFACAKVIGLKDCSTLEACVLPWPCYSEQTTNTIQIAEDVSLRKGLTTYKPGVSNIPFVFPTGVVKYASEGVLEMGQRQECFSVSDPDTEGYSFIKMQLTKGTLDRLYFKLCRMIPHVSQFSIQIKDQENASSGVDNWVLSVGTQQTNILNFLKCYTPDTVENGFVALEVASAKASLLLNENKELILKTRENVLLQFVKASLVHFGIKVAESTPFYQPYLKYRPHNALNTDRFKAVLQKHGFQLQKSLVSCL